MAAFASAWSGTSLVPSAPPRNSGRSSGTQYPRVPKYRKNGDGRAFVSHPSIPNKSRRLYLGKWGTKESRLEYEKWLTAFLTGSSIPTSVNHNSITVAELAVEYLTFAINYYSQDGVPTGEYAEVKASLKFFLDLFINELGTSIGPRHLRFYQQHLVSHGYRRGVINVRVGRIKRFIKWCCAQELIPPSIYQGLAVVDGLRRGRSNAKESEKVKPVPLQDVEALLPFMSPVLRAMVQLQYLCGMRPGEVCIMRGCDIDQSGPIWLYRPARHKTEGTGRVLAKAITQRGQEILKPFLKDRPETYLFSPAVSKAWRYVPPGKVSTRKTPIYPHEQRARERRAMIRELRAGREIPQSQQTGRRIGTHYSSGSYSKAIAYAHKLAAKHGVEIPHWHPHQLRHTIATQISHTLGEQAASVWLGHASLNTTAIYTERNVEELLAIAQRLDRALEQGD